ncbi:hypothetical protein Amir_4557 [Actinosynnema mirum DSM 43827]|uniref:Uncharacterized protein n=2 Tax=Actinosynnema mirum TaxID=40567 RepID=C6WLK3_ACTMD|nr:hypothetical protein Amir_4557 [Actinosynnema mirum DSM 43827]
MTGFPAHQRQAVPDVLEAHDAAQLVMATGTGGPLYETGPITPDRMAVNSLFLAVLRPGRRRFPAATGESGVLSGPIRP